MSRFFSRSHLTHLQLSPLSKASRACSRHALLLTHPRIYRCRLASLHLPVQQQWQTLRLCFPLFICPTRVITTSTYSLSTRVRISQAENATPMQELNIVELNFSPRGTYIFTWECPVELEDSTTLQVYGFLALSPTPSSAKTFFKADCSQMERPRQPGTHHHSDCSRQCQHERLRFTFSVRPITLIVGLHWTRMGPFTTLHGVQTVKGLVGHTDAATMPWSWSRNV